MAPGRGALPARDLRALERRPRGARGGEQAFAVAEHDLGVRPDVDQEAHLVGEVRRLGEHDAGGVRADVAGDARQHVRARSRVHGEAELARGQSQGLVDREGERRAAERRRVDPEQEVVHDRVADERDLEHVRAFDSGARRELGRELREAAADGAGELLLGPGVQHDVGDAAHEILAEADLRVHLAGRREHVAGREVAEMSGDGGRADVEGDAVGAVVEAGPDRRDRRAVVHGHRDRSVARVQGGLQSRQDGRCRRRAASSSHSLASASRSRRRSPVEPPSSASGTST